MGKVARGTGTGNGDSSFGGVTTGNGLASPTSAPLLDTPLAFSSSPRFSVSGESECRLQLFAPPPQRELAPWRVVLSPGDDREGWDLNQCLEAAVSAAWNTLVRLRHGDWPLGDDPRLDGLPLYPAEVEWIVEGYDAKSQGKEERRLVRFEWDGHTPQTLV